MLRRKIPIARGGSNSNTWQSTVYYHPGLKTFTNDSGQPLTVAIQYGDDPAQWTYTDESGNTYTPHRENYQGEIIQAKNPSVLDRFLTISENNYNHPILGAPARYYYTIKNDTDPVTGAVSFMPGVGNIVDLTSAGVTALDGNYGDATLQGAFSLLPFVNGKMFKRIVSNAKGLQNRNKNAISPIQNPRTSKTTEELARERVKSYMDYSDEVDKLRERYSNMTDDDLIKEYSDYLRSPNADTNSTTFNELMSQMSVRRLFDREGRIIKPATHASSATPAAGTTTTSTTASAKPTPTSSTANQAANQANKELQKWITHYDGRTIEQTLDDWGRFTPEDVGSVQYEAAREKLTRYGYLDKKGKRANSKREIKKNKEEYEKEQKAAESQSTDRYNISDNSKKVGRVRRILKTKKGKAGAATIVVGGTYLGAHGGGEFVGSTVGHFVNNIVATGKGISSGYNTTRGNNTQTEEKSDTSQITTPSTEPLIVVPKGKQIITLEDF